MFNFTKNSKLSAEETAEKEAYISYKKLAKKGDVSAQFQLGECYYNGNGVETDYKKAVEWYLKAANSGNPNAQYMLGECWEKGRGIQAPRNDNTAINWYTLSAKQGFLDAQKHLTYMYSMKRNYVEAFRWYCAAAEQGDTHSINMVGYYYLFGKGGIQKNYNEAVKCFQKLFELGKELASANLYLGICYEYGYGVEMNPEKAFSYYYDAVFKHGNVYAYFELAKCYERGFGVEQNISMAINLYSRDFTRPDSNCALGEIYYAGKGVEVNIPKAVEHIMAAALKGHIEASYRLGYFYYSGIGVVKDYGMAEHYLKRAAEKDHKEAKELLKLCEKQIAALSHSCCISNVHQTYATEPDIVYGNDSSHDQVSAHKEFLEKIHNGTLTQAEKDDYDHKYGG